MHGDEGFPRELSGDRHGEQAVPESRAAAPRGSFTLAPGSGPVVLASAGVGATPVLSMLRAVVDRDRDREVWWLHGARCGSEHAFREEARELVARLARGRIHVRYSRPEPRDDHTDSGIDVTHPCFCSRSSAG